MNLVRSFCTWPKSLVRSSNNQSTKAECLSWLFWQMGSAPYLGGGFGHFYAYAPPIEYALTVSPWKSNANWTCSTATCRQRICERVTNTPLPTLLHGPSFTPLLSMVIPLRAIGAFVLVIIMPLAGRFLRLRSSTLYADLALASTLVYPSKTLRGKHRGAKPSSPTPTLSAPRCGMSVLMFSIVCGAAWVITFA